MKRTRSIREQLLALILAVATPLLCLLSWDAYTNLQRALDQAQDETRLLAHHIAGTLNIFLGDSIYLLKRIAERPKVQRMGADGCDPYLVEFHRVFPHYLNMVLAQPNGDFLCSGVAQPRGRRVSLKGSPWITTVIGEGKPVLMPPRISPALHRWMAPLAVPVRSPQGRVIGALGVAIDLVRIQEMLNSFQLHAGTVVIITNRQGTVLARSRDPERWVGQNGKLVDIPTIPNQPAEGVIRAVAPDGVDRIYGFADVGKYDWIVYASVPSDLVQGPILKVTYYFLALAGLLVCLTMLLAVYLSRSIGRPIAALADAARAVELGDMDVLVPVAGPREVALVASRFNDMLAARRQSEERYRKLFDTESDAILMVDAAELRFVDVNQAAQQLYGYSSEEFLQLRAADIVADSTSSEDFIQALRQVGAIRVPVRYHKRKGGAVFPAEVSVTLIKVQDRELVMSVCRDVTASVKAEQRKALQFAVTRILAESTTVAAAGLQLLQTIGEGLQAQCGGLWLPDPAADVLRCAACWAADPAACREFIQVSYDSTFAREQGMPGRTWVAGQATWIMDAALDPNIPRSAVVQRCGLRGAWGVPLAVDERVIGVMEMWFRSPIPPDQELLDVLVSLAAQIAQFIERRRAEEALRKHQERLEELVEERTEELSVSNRQLQIAMETADAANQAKSTFLANMSHELRTPLNAILGYAQLLQKGGGSAAQSARAADIIRSSGEHLLTLIGDILDLAKIEAGKLELHPAELDLRAFLDGIADIVGVRAENKNLTLVCEFAPRLPLGVAADETRLRQVLLNLLGNAVKYTDAGQVGFKVGLGSREVAEGQASLRFEVKDTGIGLAQEQLMRLFQPFEQLSDIQRQEGGTGLGLVISRQLVQLMGGEIQVTSERDRGSTFWFELVLPVAIQALAARPSERAILGYRGARRQVLIVDDQEANRAVLSDWLNRLDFATDQAENGAVALVKVRDRRPDLVLMDMRMPVMGGLEATQAIKRDPELAGVVIIAVSASVSQVEERQCLEAGCSEFLGKPIDWPRLLAAMSELVNVEWIYEDGTGAVGQDELVAPPADQLALLDELVNMGDMQRVKERAEALAALGAQYGPAARKLQELARGFQERALVALVEKWKERGKGR